MRKRRCGARRRARRARCGARAIATAPAGTPSLPAAQRLALLQRLLPGITAREVSDVFATTFEPSRTVFIAELPASDGVPSEADFTALGRVAVDVKPDKPAEVAWPTTLL